MYAGGNERSCLSVLTPSLLTVDKVPAPPWTTITAFPFIELWLIFQNNTKQYPTHSTCEYPTQIICKYHYVQVPNTNLYASPSPDSEQAVL